MERESQYSSFRSLKGQAFDNRHNIVVTGLEEDSSKPPASVAEELFKTLGVANFTIKEAWRMGQKPPESSSYCRPIVVKFKHLDDLNKIWRKRMNFTPEEGKQRIKIHADLPKQLRDEINILYRISRAAAKLEEFKAVMIRNYAIQLNGKEYTPSQLESLPAPLRPSTLSNPRSEDA